MNNYYITFRSITGAQRAVRVLEKAGVRAYMQRTPKSMVTEGCGYALRIRSDKAVTAMGLLRSSGLSYGKVFVPVENGYEEVIE